MIKLSFAKDLAAIRGLPAVFVIGPTTSLGEKAVAASFSPDVGSLMRTLAADQSPGDLGAVTSSRMASMPAHLLVGVLPDRGSRYNSPARAAAIRNVVASAKLARFESVGVVLVLDDPTHALAACNAVGRALPEFSRKSNNQKDCAVHIAMIDRKGQQIVADKFVRELVAANREAARLVDTPPTELDPASYGKEIKRMLRGLPDVKLREIRGDALLEAKLGGLHAVGRCAVSEPRMLIATYSPSRKSKRDTHVALVGKGITYDTGGLHLKGRGSMEGMKADMGGSAAVLGAFYVLAKTRAVDHELSLVMCLAENAIGPSAYKPDDVLTMHSGKTVEINNTDAEGRIVLADGVSYAARVLGARTIIDAATLTGAQMVATGLLHAAVMSNDAALEARAVAAGTSSGDLCHPLPFAPEFYQQEFASPIADMRNSVKNRSNAQSSCAGQFIWSHIADTDVAWLHIDLAGPAFPQDRATGFGVALVATLLTTPPPKPPETDAPPKQKRAAPRKKRA